MRLRNIPGSKEVITESAFVVQNPEEQKGKWKEIFNSDNLEYSGDGKYLNSEQIFEQYSKISLPDYGIVFFEKVL